MKKILSLALVGVMMFSALPMAYAADNTYTNPDASTSIGTNVTVVGDGGEYYVSVPASLEPGQQGTVRAYGKWDSISTVKVWTEDTVEVTHVDTGATTDVNVTFAGIESLGNDVEDMDVSASISIDKGDIRFGEWKGVIEYNVEFVQPPKYNITVSENAWDASIDTETQMITIRNSFWDNLTLENVVKPSTCTVTYNGNIIPSSAEGIARFTFPYQGDGDYVINGTIYGTEEGTNFNEATLTITKVQ